MEKIKKPSKKKITEFLNKEFPHIEFDGIKFEQTRRENSCWFKVISYGRTIGQSEETLNEQYWDRVLSHLKWMWG